MNKQLRTIFTMLLLTLLWATGTWAQNKNYQSSYDTNFMNYAFMSNTSGTNWMGQRVYISSGGDRYEAAGSVQPNNNNMKPGIMKFVVPIGTQYIYLHGLGITDGLQVDVDVKVGSTKITTLTFLNDANDYTSGNKTIVFKGTAAKKYYITTPITFNAPLAQNTVITLTSQTDNEGFLIYGVYYEDGNLNPKGSELNPFTAGEAYAIAHDYIKLTDPKYVRGLISTQPDIITEGSPRTADFSISDDATHTNEIAVSGSYSFNGREFSSAYEILPRDKVMLRATIYPSPNAGLAVNSNKVPTLISQIHPTYEALVMNESTGSATVMTNHYDSDNPFDWPIHDCNVGHLDASESNYFYFREYYSDDPENMKILLAANPNGESGCHVVSWETMDNISLTDASNGRLMRVDTDGDNYSLFINQVADGPKLYIGGFENPQFYLHTSGGATYELRLDDDFVYRAHGIELQNLDNFYITKGQNGPAVYNSPDSENNIINASNCSNLPVVKDGGCNFYMGITGTFDFDFFVDTSNGSATLNVRPTSNEWPELRPVYFLDYIDGDEKIFKFHDNGDGTYTLTPPLTLPQGINFWFKRQYNNGPQVHYGAANGEGNPTIHRYNSSNISLYGPDPISGDNSGDFRMIGTYDQPLGTLTFTITDPNDGTTVPTLTITGWPDPVYRPTLANASNFTQNPDGTYTTTVEITADMLQEHGNVMGFDIADVSMGDDWWLYLGIPRTIYTEQGGLTPYNSTDLPLIWGDGSSKITVNTEGTYTLTINTDGTLSIDWPHKDYLLTYRPADPSIIPSTVPFEYNAGIYTVSDVQLGEGDEFWVQDAASGAGYGLSSNYSSSVVEEKYAKDIELVEGGTIAAISQSGNYTFTMREGANTTCDLQMDITGWSPSPLIVNGDCEGTNTRSFWMKETLDSEIVPARIVDGVGFNNSRGIVVCTVDSPANDWDSQFFIRLSEALPEGTLYRISFDCKASNPAIILPQCHAEPGQYIAYSSFGYVDFTDEWQHFETAAFITSDMSPSNNMQTFAFMLSGNGEYTDFFFDNIEVEILETVDIVKNGNVEGDDMSCFFKREGGGSIVQAPYTAEVGVNGTRGIMVESRDNPNSSYRDDTQFLIRLPQTLPAGTKYHVSFDYRADHWAPSESVCHAEPGHQIYEHGVGTMSFNSSWHHFDAAGIVTQEMSPNDNLQTIAFQLAVSSDANNYYFDNIKFEIDEDHYVAPPVLMGDVNGDGEVTIQDVVLVVDKTLNKPVSGFVEAAADVTNDGQIDISDVVAIVNLVLKKN